MRTSEVSTAGELLAALADGDEIEIAGSQSGMPTLSLRPGVTLGGGTLRFGAKGVRMSADNRLEDITILVPDHEVAIGNDTSVPDLGRLTLRNVRTRGQVLLIADDAVRAGHIEIESLAVAAANVRGRQDRPHGYGVEAMQGAVTLWNRQRDPAVQVTAHLDGISAGTAETPVRGSGVFVAGVELGAIAISVPAGGRIGRLTVGGTLSTSGDQIVTLEGPGSIDSLHVGGGISASGAGSDVVHAAGTIGGLDEISTTAAHGQAVVRGDQPLAHEAP
jgi:hypothetical protein